MAINEGLYYKNIIDNQIEGIALIDTENRFLYANRAAHDLFEASPESLIDRVINDFIEPKNLKSFEKEIQTCRDNGSGKMYSSIRTIKGRQRQLSFSTRVQEIDAQGSKALSIVFCDISDKKKIEDEVRMVATATRNANDCIFITDMHDRILYANPSFFKTYLYEAEEIIDSSAALLRSTSNSPELLTEMLQGTLDGGWKGELLHLKKDGTEFPVSLSTSLVKDDDGESMAIISIARDITRDRQISKELTKVQELEMIGYLARGIAHNFNNILTAIVGYISLAQLSKDNEVKLTTNLAEAEKACLRARDLTQQLLGFSKGTGSLRRAASIKELITESASFAVTGTNLECRFKIENKLATVEVDEAQISQVINNIVMNAVQASPAAGVITITASNVTIKKKNDQGMKPGDYITISIKDEGDGIADDIKDKVFNPFFSTKDKHSGLGLPISFSIIRKHDGYIKFSSVHGKGATFTIYLPVSGKRAENGDSKTDLRKPEGGRKILIMDDERDVRTIIGSLLESYGYQVDYAVDGDEVLQLIKDACRIHDQKRDVKKHDMAILNLTIPAGKGAKEIIDEVKAINPDIFAVVSTGYAKDPMVTDYKNRGFQEVLVKPFEGTKLITLLNKLEEYVTK